MNTADRLPDWALWIWALGPSIGAVATAMIAAAVGVVAWRQWQTARDKLHAEMFNLRFQYYEDFTALLPEIGTSDCIDKKEFRAKYRWETIEDAEAELIVRARLLFGEKVSQNVKKACSRAKKGKIEGRFEDLLDEVFTSFIHEMSLPLRRK